MFVFETSRSCIIFVGWVLSSWHWDVQWTWTCLLTHLKLTSLMDHTRHQCNHKYITVFYFKTLWILFFSLFLHQTVSVSDNLKYAILIFKLTPNLKLKLKILLEKSQMLKNMSCGFWFKTHEPKLLCNLPDSVCHLHEYLYFISDLTESIK